MRIRDSNRAHIASRDNSPWALVGKVLLVLKGIDVGGYQLRTRLNRVEFVER